MKVVNESSRFESGNTVNEITGLLARWQDDHDPAAFDALWRAVGHQVEQIVARALRRRGIRDPGACDDATALVIAQIHRLGSVVAPHSAARFDAGRTPADGSSDPCWAYLRCVAESRARDVARARWRRSRHETCHAAAGEPSVEPAVTDSPAQAAVARLEPAVALLDEQARIVVTLLLEGKSQAVAAHVLGVCEGTVSRIRARAIARLRTLLAEESGPVSRTRPCGGRE